MHTHRHIVALPLALLIAVVPVVGSLHGQLLSANISNASRWLQVPNAMILPQEESTRINLAVSPVAIDAGSALVSVSGKATVQAGGFEVVGIDGTFQVIAKAKAVTVSAITAPVLVKKAGEVVALIPSTMQWRWSVDDLPSRKDGVAAWYDSRKPTLLPKQFLEEQRKAMDTLPAIEVHVPVTDLPTPPSKSEPLKLPQTLEREREEWLSLAASHLRYLLEAGKAEEFVGILSMSDIHDAVSAELLPFAANDALAFAKLTEVLADDDVLLLARLHSHYTLVSWSLPEPKTLTDGTVLTLLLSPLEVQSQPLQEFVQSRWEDAFVSALSQVEDPAATLAVLLSEMRPVLAGLEERGYPERVRDVIAMIENLMKRLPTVRSQSIDELLAAIRSVTVPVVVTEVASSLSMASESSDAVPLAPFAAEQIAAAARQMLGTAGAIFTVQTRIDAVSPREVKVTDIGFAGATSVRLFNVVLDPETSELSHIEESGTTLPFAIPLQEFATWVKNEK